MMTKSQTEEPVWTYVAAAAVFHYPLMSIKLIDYRSDIIIKLDLANGIKESYKFLLRWKN